MNMEEEKRLYQLFAALAEDRITEEEHAELQAMLRVDAGARQLWFEYQDLEAGLGDGLEPALLSASSGGGGWRLWFAGRPWLAAAAGVVLGIFAASSVWALTLNRDASHGASKTALFGESFEARIDLPEGFPSVPGQWSGSPSEVAGTEAGVSPLDGARMLRLDPDGSELTSRMFLIVDLETLPRQAKSGLLELKSYFHETEAASRTRIITRAALFTGELEAIEEDWLKKGWSEIGDHAVSQATRAFNLDPGMGGWQEMNVSLKASAEARYLVVMLGGFSVTEGGEKLPFYLDDLRVSCLKSP